MWGIGGAARQILANGTDVVFDRVNETALEARAVSFLDPRHPPLMARLNVYRAFEPIEPSRSVGAREGGSRADHPDAAERGARAERRAKRDGALLRSALPRMQGLRAGLPRRLRQAPLHRLFRVAQRGSLRGAARRERADVLSRFGSM